MTIEYHSRPFGARIVDGVKVAALLFVLSVIVAAADRTLVSPDAVEFRGGFAPPDAAPAVEHATAATLHGPAAAPAASYFPTQFAAPTGAPEAHVEAF